MPETTLRSHLRRICRQWMMFGLVLLVLFAVLGLAQFVWEIAQNV